MTGAIDPWAEAEIAAEEILEARDGHTEKRILDVAGRRVPVYFRMREDGRHTIVVIIEADETALPTEVDIRRRFRLTPREAQIALLLADRLSAKEIAKSKGISTHTAERHTERVLGKLGLGNRKDVRRALLKDTDSSG